MIKKSSVLLMSLLVLQGVLLRPVDAPKSPKSFYSLQLQSAEGKMIDFSAYKGKKVLLVNTATRCGYSPQLAGLEKLSQKYKGKLVVLGVPSNSFAQEPLQGKAVVLSCKKDYGVTFPLSERTPVKGAKQNQVFKWLSTKEQNGWNTKSPGWNFCKYLVDEKGELVAFFSSSVGPMDAELTDLLK